MRAKLFELKAIKKQIKENQRIERDNVRCECACNIVNVAKYIGGFRVMDPDTEKALEIASEHLYVIFALSDRHYSSVACSNKMEAAWVIKKEYTSILRGSFSRLDILPEH